ncbi:MAG: hypothetical protein M1319_00765 [Chloroflexi bacterium]|nr:hypothetical protein [Chloroflexota bacterium]
MGKASSDIESEVEWIRRDTTAIVDELQHRLFSTLDAGKQVREHPLAVGLIGTSFTALLGFAGFAVVSRTRENSRNRALVKQYLQSARALMARQQEELKRALPVDVELRPVGAAFSRSQSNRQKQGLFARLLFSALSAGVSALASYGAKRLTGYLRARYMKENQTVAVQSGP